jgi:glycosyltransferase involved in cell wall biosynthesis
MITLAVDGASWHDQMREAGAELQLVPAKADDLGAHLRALEPDIVHAHFAGYAVDATWAVWGSKARVFWHLHSALPAQRTPLRLARSLVKYRAIGGRAEAFVAVSASLARELPAWGVPREKILVIENAIETERFRPPSAEEREAARARLGIRPEERVILFFGRDREIKGVDVLLSALADRPTLTLLALGVPEPERTLFAVRVKTIAYEHVADMRAMYWASDVLALPSRREGMPYTLIEGCSTGLRAVASDLPSVREIAARFPAIRRFPPGDAPALAAALRAALDDRTPPEIAAGRAAFDLSRWVGEVLALYDSRPSSRQGL